MEEPTATSGQPTADEARHLTPDDLAARLGISVGAVYQMNRRRTGPQYLKIGRRVRYKLTDVIEWENAHYRARSAS
ncbi:Helix-turn-helix domain-containing protein [Thermomonospora echinospora]|uniref:Helix-turn-helix domain-containing protein n=1 Tax=Thermomonospora echinospora TaxID=1992 RepID=A0A1H6A7S1_9ACTN|nr:helix-turn-helix domain-containing protein [Thermomonospora echinospora]SEG44224.1 Helix-turn-helix domain-containing protein [Thermomonospora echinospora]